jgi:N-acetylglucosaminyldiphosphoundecaprenol N-acetyl-beta-D-mannosaminyltransferase
MVVAAQHNTEFKESISTAELVIPDGSSLLWAKEYVEQNTRPNLFLSLLKFMASSQWPLTGVDSIYDICEAVEQRNGSVYLVGGKTVEATRAAQILQKRYPTLGIETCSENDINTIQPLRLPCAVFVALGHPKQSIWIERNREALKKRGIRIALGVGGAFAMIAGTLPRAPKILRRFHLEWLWRLVLEPKRIKRIWNAVVVFPELIYKTTR